MKGSEIVGFSDPTSLSLSLRKRRKFPHHQRKWILSVSFAPSFKGITRLRGLLSLRCTSYWCVRQSSAARFDHILAPLWARGCHSEC